MRAALIRIADGIDGLVGRVGSVTSWLTLVLVILICLDVFMRYFLNTSKIWILELEWHLFSILFLLGASYTLLYDKHVRVDLYYDRIAQRKKNVVNAVGVLLFMVPWCLVVLDTSWDYASNSFSFREGSSQPNGLPARYLIKFMIWIGFLLLLLQALSVLIKAIFGHKTNERWKV